MKDKFNRDINYLRLSITNRCNYQCFYCGNTCDKKVIDIPLERIIEFGKSAADLGIHKIRLTGGEPTTRKDIFEIISELKNIDGINEVGITTNGWNLRSTESKLIDAGLDSINVSIDSLKSDIYKKITNKNSLYEVINGIKESSIIKKKINVVLMNHINTDEITDFVELTKYNNIDVRFIEFMPVGQAKDKFNKLYVSNKIVLKNNQQLSYIGDNGVSSIYQIDGYAGRVGLINPISKKFCKDCNKIRITSDEKLLPCLHSNLEIDLSGISGEKLTEKIKEGILLKPKEHFISEDDFEYQRREMKNIGG